MAFSRTLCSGTPAGVRLALGLFPVVFAPLDHRLPSGKPPASRRRSKPCRGHGLSGVYISTSVKQTKVHLPNSRKLPASRKPVGAFPRRRTSGGPADSFREGRARRLYSLPNDEQWGPPPYALAVAVSRASRRALAFSQRSSRSLARQRSRICQSSPGMSSSGPGSSWRCW